MTVGQRDTNSVPVLYRVTWGFDKFEDFVLYVDAVAAWGEARVRWSDQGADSATQPRIIELSTTPAKEGN